jgi:hypothetical protein
MQHEFVEYIPDALEADRLYISLEYNIAVHKCACGCGVDVVTPLSPAEWALTYDGKAVSLWPSIGNWSFPCKSHYIIKNGRVRWAGRFDSEKIRAVRQRDSEAKARQYGGSAQRNRAKAAAEISQTDPIPTRAAPKIRKGFFRKIFGN